MNSLENFHRFMARDEPRWLPAHVSLTPPVLDVLRREMGTADVVEAFDLDFRVEWAFGDSPESHQAWREAFARLNIDLPADAEVGYCGITRRVPDPEKMGAAYHLREIIHPLAAIERIAQLESLPWPAESGPMDLGRLTRFVEDAHAHGKVALVPMECTVFEPAWYLRGMDNLLMDMVEGNEISLFLLDWFTRRSVAAARVACRAGAEVIGLGDDVGTQRGMLMSVEFWQTHLKPRLASVVAAIRDEQHAGRKVYVRYHSDGDIRPIIDDLIEIGVDFLNPVQPECMPLEDVIPRYQDRIAFWGTVGIQDLLPFGTPRQIREHVERCAAWVRDGARIIVAPTHVIEPDVPWQNLCALVEAIKGAKLS